jgi:hypothetical protein
MLSGRNRSKNISKNSFHVIGEESTILSLLFESYQLASTLPSSLKDVKVTIWWSVHLITLHLCHTASKNYCGPSELLTPLKVGGVSLRNSDKGTFISCTIWKVEDAFLFFSFSLSAKRLARFCMAYPILSETLSAWGTLTCDSCSRSWPTSKP